MTELEKKLLATVERLENESREREQRLLASLQALSEHYNEAVKRLNVLTEQYSTVIRYLESLP